MNQTRLSLITRGPTATRELGQKTGERLKAGSVIALIGELGCGKTCFTKGLCAGLGIPKKQVNSPTFAFVNEYQGRLLVLHLDLYRIDDVSAGLDVGIMDYMARAEKGIAIIEWADKVLPLLPDDRLVVQFDVLSPRKRQLELTAHGKRFGTILRDLEACNTVLDGCEMSYPTPGFLQGRAEGLSPSAFLHNPPRVGD